MKNKPSILCVLTLLLCACAAPLTKSSVDIVKSGQVSIHDAFVAGEISRLDFSAWGGPALPVWLYIPSGVDVRTAPVLMMLHGAKRESLKYLLEWRPLAQEHGFIVIAPEFSELDFPGSRGYNLGNVFLRDEVELRDETQWSFSAIEPLFDHVVSQLHGEQSQYTIFGHSAGSQFVHRFMYYKPTARVKRYLIANAGWYTLPDEQETYPYGLQGASTPAGTVARALEQDVVVLLGDKDIDSEHSSLRRTPEAMRQGANRLARGSFFYSDSKKRALQMNIPFGWRLVIVENVAHSNGGMAVGALPYID